MEANAASWRCNHIIGGIQYSCGDEMSEMITYSDFEKVDIRAGRIISAEPFPEAKKPAIRLTIDFGSLGLKKSSAQITMHYVPESLVGKTVIAVVNFPPKQIANFISEVLVLGLPDSNGNTVLVFPDKDVEPGAKLH